MLKLHRHHLRQRRAAHQAARHRRRRLRARRDLRERPAGFARAGARDRRDDARPRAHLRGVPAVSRLRRHARGLARRVFDRAERKFDVLAGARHRPDAGQLECVAGLRSPIAAASSMTSASSASAPPRADCASASRRWPGARHVRDHRDAWEIVRAGRIIRRSAWRSMRSVRWRPASPSTASRRSIPRKLFHVQIADAPKLAMDPLSWSRHFRCMPGQGDLPLVEYVQRAASSAATTACCRSRSSTIDFAPDRRPRSRSTACARSTICSSRWSACGARCRPTSGSPARESSSSNSAPARKKRGSSARCCARWGSLPTHRHVRKAVTRWRQGDINLVVNCEPEGFAHSYDTVHGASVCAIGLRVADPDAALRRAQRLQIQSFSQPVGPGEYEIPALRGVGGSLIYFMKESETPSIWRTEFEELPRDPIVRRCRARASRSFLAEHAVRGDALLAAVLRDAVPGRQERGDRDRRSGGSRAEPGDPVGAIGAFASC